jgi:hypothetical protein
MKAEVLWGRYAISLGILLATFRTNRSDFIAKQSKKIESSPVMQTWVILLHDPP